MPGEPRYGYPSNAPPTQNENINSGEVGNEQLQPMAAPTLDLASLWRAFVVPPNGRLALCNLRITGALLANLTYPLPASSFLLLAAFQLTGSRAAQPPPVQLSNLVISTPSCAALWQHQEFACRASPSPNFTVTPSSLVVHRFSTPTASITNVALVCSGAPIPRVPCLARKASSGAEALDAMRVMNSQAEISLAQSAGGALPGFLYLDGNITLAGSRPPAAPLALSAINLMISGCPAGGTVLDLANSAGLVTIVSEAMVQLVNMTLRNPPLAGPSASPWGLLGLYLWTFDFARKMLGGQDLRLWVHDVVLEVTPEELASWFADAVGLDAVPPELRADLVVFGGSVLTGATNMITQALEAPGECPSLLVKNAEGWSQIVLMENVLLTTGDQQQVCCSCGSTNSSYDLEGSSAGSSYRSSGNDAIGSGGVGGPTTPPLGPPDCNGPTGNTSLCAARTASPSPLRHLVPEGVTGTIVYMDSAAAIDNLFAPWRLTQYVKSFPFVLWMLSNDVVALLPPLDSHMPAARRMPALLGKSAVLIGSFTQPAVLDVAHLAAAVVFTADNITVTVRAVILVNLPPAGLYPFDFQASLVPPPRPSFQRMLAASPPIAPREPMRHRRAMQGGPLRRTGVVLDVGHSGSEEPNVTNGSSPGDRSISSDEAAGPPWGERASDDCSTRKRTLTQRLKLGMSRQLRAQDDARAPRSLSPALTNFTSCIWTLDFDRQAAAALQGFPTVHASTSGTADSRNPGGNRPVGLPYVFLDSVVLVIPQPELDVLAWAWAANSTAAATDPGLADQLAMMLAASRLSAESTAAVQSAPPPTASLSFDRLWWCGLQGRNVTFTSQPPVIGGVQRSLTPLQLELPVSYSLPSPPRDEPTLQGSQPPPLNPGVSPPALFMPASLPELSPLPSPSTEPSAPAAAAARSNTPAPVGILAGAIGAAVVVLVMAALAIAWLKSHCMVSTAVGASKPGSDDLPCPAVVEIECQNANDASPKVAHTTAAGPLSPASATLAARFFGATPATTPATPEPQVPPPETFLDVEATAQYALTLMYHRMHRRLLSAASGTVVGHPSLAGRPTDSQSPVPSSGERVDREPPEPHYPTFTDSASAGATNQPVNARPDSPTASAGGFDDILVYRGELGRGAQGVVHRGVWRGLDVAIKGMLLQRPAVVSTAADRAPNTDTELQFQRAIREAAISSSVSHPNVVATYTYMLQRLGEDRARPPGGLVAVPQAPQDREQGAACSGAPASASEPAAGEMEVWKLTLVQELCDSDSLRHCLERGTLTACTAWKRPTEGTWEAVAVLAGTRNRGSAGHPSLPAAGQLGGRRQVVSPQSGLPRLSRSSATAPVEAIQATQRGAPQPRVVLALALQVGRGLAHLHRRAIVHADVSSANVLLKSVQGGAEGAASATSAGGTHTYMYGYVAKVSDFGLSGRLDRSGQATHLSGPARRSSAYSAPELVRHGRSSPAGDVYAYAVVLWEVALGAPLPALLARPEGARVCEWLAAQAQLDPEEASALPPDLLVWPGHLPPAFSALVGDCLHADPASRPSSLQACWRLDAMLLDAGWDDS